MSTTRAARTIVGITGHRPDKFDDGYELKSPIQDWVKRELQLRFKRLKATRILTGMALGVDQWAADVAIEMGIPFEAYVPFEGQESIWPSESKIRYYGLLERAARVRTVCTPGYEPWKMQKRNEAIVNDCTVLVAVFDGSQGGTANCVQYACNVGKRRIIIDPSVGERFIDQRIDAMRKKSSVYVYEGNLKWKSIVLKPAAAVSAAPCGECGKVPALCQCIPF